jgi:DNA-binding LacI/PurR family transcriptional regulator
MLIPALIYEITCHGFQARIVDLQELKLIYDNFTKAVIQVTRDKSAGELEAVRKLSLPVISVNNWLPFFHNVCTRHREGSRLGADYLLQHGHRRHASP